MPTTEDDEISTGAPQRRGRRAAGEAKTTYMRADDLDASVDSAALLADLGWTGSLDDYIDMLLVAEGKIAGLERFRTGAHQQFVVHINGFDAAEHGELQCKLFDASAEVNARWKQRTGRPLISISGS